MLLARLRGCVEPLTDAQVWCAKTRPAIALQSVAALNGNVGQWLWLVQPAGGQPKPACGILAERELIPASVLLDRLGATLQQASEVLIRLTPR